MRGGVCRAGIVGRKGRSPQASAAVSKRWCSCICHSTSNGGDVHVHRAQSSFVKCATRCAFAWADVCRNRRWKAWSRPGIGLRFDTFDSPYARAGGGRATTESSDPRMRGDRRRRSRDQNLRRSRKRHLKQQSSRMDCGQSGLDRAK
jgi:hypothetical protein